MEPLRSVGLFYVFWLHLIVNIVCIIMIWLLSSALSKNIFITEIRLLIPLPFRILSFQSCLPGLMLVLHFDIFSKMNFIVLKLHTSHWTFKHFAFKVADFVLFLVHYYLRPLLLHLSARLFQNRVAMLVVSLNLLGVVLVRIWRTLDVETGHVDWLPAHLLLLLGWHIFVLWIIR